MTRIHGRMNYVVIGYDGKIQFAGTQKAGKAFFYNMPYTLQGFSGKPFSFRISLETKERNVTCVFFTYKKDMIEYVNNYNK